MIEIEIIEIQIQNIITGIQNWAKMEAKKEKMAKYIFDPMLKQGYL